MRPASPEAHARGAEALSVSAAHLRALLVRSAYAGHTHLVWARSMERRRRHPRRQHSDATNVGSATIERGWVRHYVEVRRALLLLVPRSRRAALSVETRREASRRYRNVLAAMAGVRTRRRGRKNRR